MKIDFEYYEFSFGLIGHNQITNNLRELLDDDDDDFTFSTTEHETFF